MANLKYVSLKSASFLTIAATAMFAIGAAAQSVTDKCGLAQVIPLTTPEPPALSSTVSRTFILSRCSAPVLRPLRRVSGTFT